MPSSWAVTSQHFGLKEDSQCLEMANPDTNSKQRHGSSLWVCLVHFYSFSYAAHTVYGTEIPTIHKLMQTPSLFTIFLSNTLIIYVIVFIASLNPIVISGTLDAKNAQQNEKKNRTDSSACVCPLGWERWVNKGKKKSKQGSSRDQEALPPVGL